MQSRIYVRITRQIRPLAVAVGMLAALGLLLSVMPVSALPAGPRTVVLVGRSSPDDPRAEAAVHRLGGDVERQLDIVDGFRASVPTSAVPFLSSTPGVAWVSPERTLRMEGAYGQDSGLASAVYADTTRATKTWSKGTTGVGVNVAVIDTGVNTAGDLAGKVVHAEDFTAEQNNLDTYGHGTFVAGLIAGSGAASDGAVEGVAPGAGIVSLKIAGADGWTDVTRVLEALEWVVTFKDAYGIRVVNLSLGFSSPQSATIDPLDFAVERVWNAGLVVVAAAGNGNNVPGSITKPGDDPLIITAGASNDRTTVSINDDHLSTISSIGPTVDGVAKPDLIAPGRSVISSRSPGSTIDAAYPSSRIGSVYAKASGTSFAAALTSGVAALVISKSWTLNPDQVKHRLMAGARMPASGLNMGTGAGLLDAFNPVMETDDLTAANQGVAPAVGGGSIQATRGDGCLRDAEGLCVSDADADAALGFDSGAYFASSWAGSTWSGTQWSGTQWSGTQWSGTQWSGTQWSGTQSSGTQWSRTQWSGTQWSGTQWTGTQWTGTQWTGTQWSGSPWASFTE